MSKQANTPCLLLITDLSICNTCQTISNSGRLYKFKNSTREFYKSVKAMRLRNAMYNPITMIDSKDGNPPNGENSIKHRWQEHFTGLLNPAGPRNTQYQFTPRHPDHEERTILKSEVRKALKSSPRNKAARVDEITTEAILACGETRIKWLTTVFQKAWKDRKVPEDWQRAMVVRIWKKGSKKDCGTYR